MNHHREISTQDMITFWKGERDKILKELHRRIEAQEAPEAFQHQVKHKYEMIQATIRDLERNYRPSILEELKQKIELEERGYMKPGSRMLGRALQTA